MAILGAQYLLPAHHLAPPLYKCACTGACTPHVPRDGVCIFCSSHLAFASCPHPFCPVPFATPPSSFLTRSSLNWLQPTCRGHIITIHQVNDRLVPVLPRPCPVLSRLPTYLTDPTTASSGQLPRVFLFSLSLPPTVNNNENSNKIAVLFGRVRFLSSADQSTLVVTVLLVLCSGRLTP